MHSRDAIHWHRFDPPGGARVAQREVDEFDRLESNYPHGVSAAQIVDFFAPRGVRLAQATFRKYVQLGLLPRSRRVGEKGKTLEEIRHSFVFFRGQLDGVERALDDLFAALDKTIAEKGNLRASRRRELERLLTEGRHKANQFVTDIERTVSQITAREETGKGDR